MTRCVVTSETVRVVTKSVGRLVTPRLAQRLAHGLISPLGGRRALALFLSLGALSPAPALGQTPRGPSAEPCCKGSGRTPSGPAGRLEKLAANVVAATINYRASLERVLTIYERDLERASELTELRQDLYQRGVLSKSEFEAGERALATAQRNVDDTRRAMAEADHIITEARVAEQLARLTPLAPGGYEESATLIRYNGAAGWSLAADTPRLQQFFADRFGRPLPVSAYGQTSLHDRLGFDHRDALDVAVHPDSPEGRTLMDFLRAAGIPFIAAWGAVAGSSSGAHIHVGQPSPRLTGRR